MPQNKETGLEASRFGHECARQIAAVIGAQMLGRKSNACTWNGQRAVIKAAHLNTKSVGVLYHMIDRVEIVLGAFEETDGPYRVMQLPIARCAAAMKPTRSRAPSSGRVGIVSRKLFEDEGRLVATLKV
jgi:hypothetical protein